jgi:protein-glutamine gamma-glutamyltransferase
MKPFEDKKERMGIEQFFKIISYTLIATGFLTLALTGRVDALTSALYCLALIISWQSDRPGSRLQISARTANWLVLGYVPFGIADFRVFNNSWITVLIHFVLFISIFKLFQVKQDRDWVFLYLLAIFEVLLSAGLTIDAMFLVMLVVFVFTGLATLETFEIRRTRRFAMKQVAESAFTHDGARAKAPARPVRYLLGTTFVMAALIGLFTVPIFFLMPRFNTGLLSQAFGDTSQAMTGFSDNGFQLGDVGEIKKDSQIVMRVRVEGPVPERLHWRGVALTNFDGQTWSKSAAAARRNYAPSGPEVYVFNNRRVVKSKALTQTFYLEPMNTSVMFYGAIPVAGKNLRGLSADITGTFYRTETGQRASYTVISDTNFPDPDALRRDPMRYSGVEKDVFLQLPESFNPRIAQLAREVSKDAPTAFDKAQSIERYLQTRFGYTLDRQRTDEPDPLTDFLFNIRAGHCEYFASAMTLMLRSQGVAARVASGYQAGEYNEVNQSFIVRQSDAHSWVEAYFPETKTWIEFDPTPAAGIEPGPSGLLAQMQRYVDAMRLFYLDYVIAYDASRQRSLARDAGNATVAAQASYQQYMRGFRLEFGRWMAQLNRPFLALVRNPQLSLGLALAGLFIGGGAAAALAIRITRRLRNAPGSVFRNRWLTWLFLPWLRFSTRNDAQRSAVLFYNEMLDVLARSGVKRPEHLTPAEFAAQVDLPPVIELTQAYNAIRFGGAETAAFDAARMRERMKRLREALKRRASTRKAM